MDKKGQDILKNFKDMYAEMYLAKEILNKKYFKYTPDEVNSFLDKIINEEKNNLEKQQNPIRDEIISIRTEKEVEQYYKDNLIYDHGSETAKDECLKKISLSELKHLYSIIYSSPMRTSARKGEIIDLIEKYFEGIERALTMKP